MALLTKLVISLPPDHTEAEADRLQALLALHVSHGWQEESLPTGEMCCIVHCEQHDYCASVADLLRDSIPRAAIAVSREEETDWVESWKEFFTPVEGGSHFLVLAPWMREERAATDRIVITIEPKTAFGTGHHATTALCLEAISTLHAKGGIRKEMRFLDLGAGSGILGIACAKLGLLGDGLDIDPPAVDNALENRTVNAIPEEAFTVRLGSVAEARGPYDIILANILAEPLRFLAPQIAALGEPGAVPPLLVLSGILDVQADSVAQVYVALGFPQPARLIRGEWAALIFESSP